MVHHGRTYTKRSERIVKIGLTVAMIAFAAMADSPMTISAGPQIGVSIADIHGPDATVSALAENTFRVHSKPASNALSSRALRSRYSLNAVRTFS